MARDSKMIKKKEDPPPKVRFNITGISIDNWQWITKRSEDLGYLKGEFINELIFYFKYIPTYVDIV